MTEIFISITAQRSFPVWPGALAQPRSDALLGAGAQARSNSLAIERPGAHAQPKSDELERAGAHARSNSSGVEGSGA